MASPSDLIPGLIEPVPLQNLVIQQGPLASIHLDVLRLDRVHPLVSGNKWYKLKYNLDECLKSEVKTVVSFGGAWSNHLHALAAACQVVGIESVGVIRGHKPDVLSPSLQDMQAMGMCLHFVTREAYRRRHDVEFHHELIDTLACDPTSTRMIPEGGSNALAMQGCVEILSLHGIQSEDYDLVATACGTGATLAGLILGAAGKGRFLGVPVLKGGDFLIQDIHQRLMDIKCDHQNWQLRTEFHCGGYARQTEELQQFVRRFFDETGVPLDRVYTGKLFFALEQLVEKGDVLPGCRVLAIHTGGLQGNRSLMES
ncbi:1-aminocyclopropane-1-carboxylate deaminase/D-cysteine desulfhydrase [Kistimonas asteriae]|uniref:1-aminocyclopropane-1-carboxylate deaminase/D-cysteine desulfhydrase n=1 Tax=Kistimonas asteriae TaxID=517724 RepID=UPI001BABBCE2|nr:pyridoxal-phosphate dependent enzyme [Kistimonas asteriae]